MYPVYHIIMMNRTGYHYTEGYFFQSKEDALQEYMHQVDLKNKHIELQNNHLRSCLKTGFSFYHFGRDETNTRFNKEINQYLRVYVFYHESSEGNAIDSQVILEEVWVK
jgi:hypothetical protein